ncbi:hypothetical protein MY4824_002098 [Beauveria thailandica]
MPMSVADADGNILPVLRALAVATFGMGAMRMKWAEKNKRSAEYTFLASLAADEDAIALPPTWALFP